MTEPLREREIEEQKRDPALGFQVPAEDASLLTPAEGESVASSEDARAAAAAVAGEGAAIDAAASDVPAASEALPVDAPATPVAPPAATTDAPPAESTKPARRPVILGAVRRILTFALVVALFVGGVAIGLMTFQTSRPGSAVTQGLQPRTSPPPVAQEFIAALAANDMDAVRSSLDAQQHKDITDELERFGIHRVERVETLGTEVDGPRSATVVMMLAENAEGVPFGVNLVILVDGGKIEGFR